MVVVSEDGVYVSHHWQNTVGDNGHADLPPQFANAFINPLTGRRRASFRLDARQRKIATEHNMPLKMIEDAVNDVFPTSAQFDALTNHMSAFTAAKGVQSMVAVWDGIHGNGDTYTRTGEIMRKFIDDLVPGPATKLVEYGNTQEDAFKTSRDEGNYHGKIIVSYDSATRKYQVWMPAADLKAPILKN